MSKWEWVLKEVEQKEPDELNIDVPWANRKGRAPDIWLEVSFIIHADIVTRIPLWNLESFSFAQGEGIHWHCFYERLLL